MPTLNDDSDNVYGVNNLNYLQQQLSGYDTEYNNQSASASQEGDGDESIESSDTVQSDESGNHGDNSTSISNEGESSGDGAGDDTENKADFIAMPVTNTAPPSTVATQLQRLSQIIHGLSSDGNKSSDLGPDDLNEFLTHEKIKSETANTKESISFNSNARPFPASGKISPKVMSQILELQKKLNQLGHTRDAFSTPPTPADFSISGSGFYPADATTVHISAATPIQNPSFPEPGYSSSQIVVNRPEGSVLFSLPVNGQYSQEQQQEHKQHENSISEETLKKLLDLSKQMSTTSQPANVPGFVAPTNPTNLYGQPIIRPVFYNVPVHDLPISILTNYEKNNVYGGSVDRVHDADDGNGQQSMQKIASVSGQIESDGMNVEHRPEDIGLSTVIHNHIPITISNPSPSHSTVNRYHGISSTQRPLSDDQQQFDSYGHRRPAEHTDLNNYYPYPPFDDENRHRPYNQNPYGNNQLPPTQETPAHYVKISQSPPDEYPSYNSGVISANQPIPTFSSDDSTFTTKFYTPQPHLNNHNVNRFVNVEQTYPTLQPSSYMSHRRPTSSTYMNHVTSYHSPSVKISSSARPYDDDSAEDTFGDDGDHDGDGYGSNQDDLGDSAEPLANENYRNPNLAQSSENENVMNLLANYKNGVSQTVSSTLSTGTGANKEKRPLFSYKPSLSDKHKQFVNLAGNFISLETYQNSIEPLFATDDSLLGSKIEVLTCATGVRQANTTDCTKYFVCNSKTGKVLSYSCPSYTAFNPDTKICNAKTYAECYPNTMQTKITIENNKIMDQQVKLSLLQAQRIKNEALKAQQLAHMINLETQKILDANRRRVGVGAKATSAPISTVPHRSKKRPHRVKATKATLSPNQIRHSGKRRIPCRTEGKLADNLSMFNYFLCFRDKDGKMRARRLLCPAKLIFCASSKVCTSTQRCQNGSSKTN